MLFNSLDFIFFFAIVFLVFFLLDHKYRWPLLLLASYYFYYTLIPVYLILLCVSTLSAYLFALAINNSGNLVRKKIYLFISLTITLSILFYYKYFNFIIENLASLLDFINVNTSTSLPYANVILPIGISFFTFQILSYTLDVYYGTQKAEKNLGIFSLYVAFFPQLVAGPIERSTSLLPQLHEKKEFVYEDVVSGFRLILWGLFKKVVIADRLAIYVNNIYNAPPDNSYGAIHYILATVFFSFQIYCDFSAYSDIAIGTARSLGYKLTINFKSPYFSKSITEIWTRWHISLGIWIRNYLYMPLAMYFRYSGKYSILYTLVATFFIVGLWHGANWTYIIFGILHGLVMAYEIYFKNVSLNLKKKVSPKVYNFVLVLGTYIFWNFTLIIFRSENMGTALLIMQSIASFSGVQEIFTSGNIINELLAGFLPKDMIIGLGSILLILIIDYLLIKNKLKPLFNQLGLISRWCIYMIMIFSIIIFGVNNEAQFIYFQF